MCLDFCYELSSKRAARAAEGRSHDNNTREENWDFTANALVVFQEGRRGRRRAAPPNSTLENDTNETVLEL